MRKQYKNGDMITLNGCNGCSPSVVNGILCHEQGCPDRWRDTSKKCTDCGNDFYPDSRNQVMCTICLDDSFDRAHHDMEIDIEE
jgi:hypothetical protein